MSTKKLTAAECTPAVIKEWKEKHGSIFCYTASDGKKAYFRTPTRQEIEAANSVGANKPIQSNEILAKAVFMGGDEEILTVDKYFFGFSAQLKTLIQTVEGELAEL